MFMGTYLTRATMSNLNIEGRSTGDYYIAYFHVWSGSVTRFKHIQPSRNITSAVGQKGSRQRSFDKGRKQNILDARLHRYL